METPQLGLPNLPHIDFANFVTLPVLNFFLIAFFAGYVVISGILIYHWTMYGMRSPGIILAQSLFIFVSAVLFTVSTLSLHYF